MSEGFKEQLITRSEGVTAYSVMSECERHGIVSGCTSSCPVLIRGECEFQDDECKDLYKEAMGEG